jgi:hypothetical protein
VTALWIKDGHATTTKPRYHRIDIADVHKAVTHVFTEKPDPRVVIGSLNPRNRRERFLNRIKQWRRVATRYDRLAANYLAFIKLASIRI